MQSSRFRTRAESGEAKLHSVRLNSSYWASVDQKLASVCNAQPTQLLVVFWRPEFVRKVVSFVSARSVHVRETRPNTVAV